MAGLSRSLRALVVLAVLPAAIALPAAAATPAAPAETTVEIRGFAFVPKEITVTTGTTLAWTNRDAAPHALAANDRSFTSTGLDTGDSYRHRFDRAGDFPYVCTLHPFMTGVVHVRPAHAATADAGPQRSR